MLLVSIEDIDALADDFCPVGRHEEGVGDGRGGHGRGLPGLVVHGHLPTPTNGAQTSAQENCQAVHDQQEQQKHDDRRRGLAGSVGQVRPEKICTGRTVAASVTPWGTSTMKATMPIKSSGAVFHHVLPLAMPGVLTGTIIGMAHALGETAPLLMIGMVAFIVDMPDGVTDAATVLPVQIYLWSDLPEVGFQAKTAAAIIVLLVFLFVMNAAGDPAAPAFRASLVAARRCSMDDQVAGRPRRDASGAAPSSASGRARSPRTM